MISCPQIRIKQMKRIAIICVILCTPLLINAQVQIPTLDDLDHEIAMSSQYDKQYEDVIRSVKKQLHAAKTLKARCELSDKLFNLYTSYSVDSAIVYAMEKQKIAKASSDELLSLMAEYKEMTEMRNILAKQLGNNIIV